MAVIGAGNPAHVPASPPSVAHGIVRPSVLRLLDGRWNHAVTVVIAGAGFGKSVALGQAMRANQASPRGVEAWLSCRSGCEDPARFAHSVRHAFGLASGGGRDPLQDLQDAIGSFSPVETTLVLDDVEVLEGTPACAELLDQLIHDLGTGAHIVLAGRTLPPLRLTRLRAAGQLLALDEHDLRFTESDVAALARSLKTAVPPRDVGGWPALVRLALTSPDAVDDFLGEEVIEALGPDDRRALAALTILGPSAPSDVAAVCGRPFDATRFCGRVPLVHQAGDQVVAHSLWEPVREKLVSPSEAATIARRALDVVADRDDGVAAGMLALRIGDEGALGRAAVALVRATLGSLPVGVADAWLAATTTASPHLELLACARAHADVAAEPPAERLDAVMAQFRTAGDLDGELVALALAALVANATHDVWRLVELAGHARRLVPVSTTPVPALQLLIVAIDAAAAAQAGDIETALSHLGQPIDGLDPTDRPEALVRLHWHLLLLAGRANEAAQVAAGTAPAPLAVQRELAAVARWFDGDPLAFEAGNITFGPDRYTLLDERDRFDHAAFLAVLAAGAGERDTADDAVQILTSSPFAAAAPADVALLAVARAALHVMDHDDDAATSTLEALLAQHPIEGLTEACLRRYPAIGYVCSAQLRDRWDAADLGPSQRRACTIARLLVDARTGKQLTTAPDPLPAVGTVLPLPWSVELAARAAGQGASWGLRLAEELADRIGPPVHAELEHLEASGDRRARRGAEILTRALPTRPQEPVAIRVLGPLEIRRDGRPVEAPELRRSRVRELLSLLVLERTVARDRAVDLLWRDHDLDKARANLRVTLGHLRKLLEPDRPTRAPSYFLRADADYVRLADVAGLDVDLWTVTEALEAAEAARQAADAEARADHLVTIAGHWRGRPLPDLDRLDELGLQVRSLSTRLVEAVLALGELELVRGGLIRAGDCAERVLTVDPYNERSLRLALAAAVQNQDRPGAEAAIALLHERLGEIGARPDALSAMLLRQAASWLGEAKV